MLPSLKSIWHLPTSEQHVVAHTLQLLVAAEGLDGGSHSTRTARRTAKQPRAAFVLVVEIRGRRGARIAFFQVPEL